MPVLAKLTRSVFVAGLLLSGAPAFADDFVALCKPGLEAGKDADKVCACMSEKVTANRSDALAAMKLMNDTKGNPDPAAVTPAFTQALEAVGQAELACSK